MIILELVDKAQEKLLAEETSRRELKGEKNVYTKKMQKYST